MINSPKVRAFVCRDSQCAGWSFCVEFYHSVLLRPQWYIMGQKPPGAGTVVWWLHRKQVDISPTTHDVLRVTIMCSYKDLQKHEIKSDKVSLQQKLPMHMIKQRFLYEDVALCMEWQPQWYMTIQKPVLSWTEAQTHCASRKTNSGSFPK